MARAQATDPLHNFRFHVRAGRVGGGDPLQPSGTAEGFNISTMGEAGFQSVTTPEYQVESVDYREGLMTYTQKYPGIPTTNELTMMRGVARYDTAFYRWVLDAIEGRQYRADLTIFHALREGRSSPFSPGDDFAPARSKQYQVLNAFPIRVKPAADMDSSASDVSLAEVDVAYEQFNVVTPPAV